MRLLVVTQYFWPENFRVNDLVAELVHRGHEVTVLTGYPNYPAGEFFPQFIADPSRFKRYEGAEVVRVPHSARGKGGVRLLLNYFTFAVSATVAGLFKLRGRSFDAIYCYEPSPITVGLPAVALRAVKKAPLTLWVLDLWPETLEAIGVVKSRSLLKLVGKMVSFIYRRCDVILAQSRSFIPQIAKYAGQQRRIEYFPSWAESVFDLNKATAAPELLAAPDKFTIMFAGNVGDAQDFPAILNAAEQLKDDHRIRWVIVGDGRLSGWLEQEVQSRGLTGSVLLMGRFPVERMPSFFKHASALLVSLKDEPIFAMTIPGKLQSYLAAGIPMLAMLNGEGADVVRIAEAGLTCNAGDADALARAVIKMADMPAQEREQMGRNGQAASAEQFDRAHLISRLENIFVSLSEPDGPDEASAQVTP